MVSVIMPAFNAGNYIESAINSVMSQTYRNWELIVVNDASVDDTLSKIERLQESDSRIKAINLSTNGELLQPGIGD